jgi:hypothetical protein
LRTRAFEQQPTPHFVVDHRTDDEERIPLDFPPEEVDDRLTAGVLFE